ncbi:exosome component 10 [Drosophila pseudoobscura]|uniref:Exosome complex component 10 homolog n=1 Tax=Drosophila pseudoobscura pseudoobscura TaxID=46245 RepID=A0A6I8UN99_DROPS|nr:exosome component 10 [Drosophila pseudoobscura]XP_033232593.1 exosome component 10 [Drosophila pseudoobscura]
MQRSLKRKQDDQAEDDQPEQPPKIESAPAPDSGIGDIKDFTKQAFKNVVAATRACNSFPQGTARSLYLGYPGYSRVIDDLSQRLMGLIGSVMQAEEIKGDIKKRHTEEQFEMVQECNDIIFERITTNLDIKAGQRRKPHMVLETQVDVMSPSTPAATAPAEFAKSETPKAGSWNRWPPTPQRNVLSARLFAAKNIMRPQMNFKTPVDNSDQNPFVPRLKEKPNSLKPLALLPEYDEAGNVHAYLHPYEFELMKLEPSAEQLQRQTPLLPAPPAATELMLVDSVEKLNQALEELRRAPHIAIDVEHHSYRTFMGITCLVQMSTRTKDYIFDSLALREEMHVLNLVLTDPKKVKILHGADQDIEWLQRDLSLYVVNMFDTHRAAKALNMARLSLAFLLKHYVDLDVDKSLQLADWRMRPLPQQLIDYARQDTHYLIYVYERMTNDLLQAEQGQSQALRTVYQLSTEVCKKRYTKPHVGPESHLDLVRKTKRSFDNRQLHALRGIFQWRDATARQEDESYGYVLPNHMMLQIAESLPREMQGILACCNPIPPLVRQQLHALHQIVLKAREQPLVKPILEARSQPQVLPPTSKDYGSKLYCPHDFTHLEETRDDLPTLLNRNASGKLQLPAVEEQPRDDVPLAVPAMTLFAKPTVSTPDEEMRLVHLRKESQVLRMPYKRYLAILPLMEQVKADQRARDSKELLKRRLCPPATPTEDIKLESSSGKVEAADDAVYSLPLKEQLKRKHKPDSDQHPSTSKRLKEGNIKPKPESAPVPVRGAVKNESITCISDEDDDVVEVPIQKKPIAQAAEAPSKRQQKRKQFQRFRGGKARGNHPQSSSQPVVQQPKPQGNNFDYKNVDFRQFQGGAQRARGTEIKQTIRGKNRPNNRNNKQFNKLFTFSNVKKDGKK